MGFYRIQRKAGERKRHAVAAQALKRPRGAEYAGAADAEEVFEE